MQHIKHYVGFPSKVERILLTWYNVKHPVIKKIDGNTENNVRSRKSNTDFSRTGF